ncbi:hypothetical protein ScPMuIL_003469 [Solemya velum]
MRVLYVMVLAVFHVALSDTLTEVLESKLELLVMKRLLEHCKLTETLLSENVTIFAPVNGAFRNLSEDMLDKLSTDYNLMVELLKYHVVIGNESLQNDGRYQTMNGRHVRYNNYQHNEVSTVDGVIITEIVPINNGALYIIDEVLIPYPNRTVLDIISTDPDFSQSYEFIKIAKMEELLLGDDVTAFIPVNAGYEKLGAAVRNNVAMTPNLLKEIFGYHLTHGTLYSPGLYNSEKVRTLSTLRDTATIRQHNGYTRVNYATIKRPDIKATNGVVHGINLVLVQSRFYTAILSG